MGKNRRKAIEKSLDKLCSEYVKLRDNYKCVWCGRDVSSSSPYRAQWSHVEPRGLKRLRWSPANSKTLCYTCHTDKWHLKSLGILWFKNKYPDRYEYLQAEKRKGTKRWTLAELEALQEWFKKEIKKLKGA